MIILKDLDKSIPITNILKYFEIFKSFIFLFNTILKFFLLSNISVGIELSEYVT